MKSAKTVLGQYLKNKGMLSSKQREQILDVFLKTEKHPTIDDLYHLVRKKNSKIGLATVYRAMKVICDAGLAREADFGDGFRRFEHKYQRQHHDHLVCLKCGTVIEVTSLEIEKLQDKLAKSNKFTPLKHRMQIFGTCSKCRHNAKYG